MSSRHDSALSTSEDGTASRLATLPGELAQLGAVEVGLRLPECLADDQHLVDLRGVAADQQVDDPGRERRLLQLLQRGGEVLVGLVLLDQRVTGGGELGQGQAVEPVGGGEQRVGGHGHSPSSSPCSIA